MKQMISIVFLIVSSLASANDKLDFAAKLNDEKGYVKSQRDCGAAVVGQLRQLETLVQEAEKMTLAIRDKKDAGFAEIAEFRIQMSRISGQVTYLKAIEQESRRLFGQALTAQGTKELNVFCTALGSPLQMPAWLQ